MSPSSSPGLFIVLEGVEGAGKTTQGRLLAEWMTKEGIEHVHAREPGGTSVGEAIRGLLLDRRELRVPAETELLLMLAARAAFVRELVVPTLERGAVMLADRFEASTFAYQGIGRGLGLERVRELNRFATGGVSPDLLLVLDLPVREGRARQESGGKEEDRIEGAGLEFLERVREGYRTLAASDPTARLVDAARSPEEVQDELREHVRTLLQAAGPELADPPRG